MPLLLISCEKPPLEPAASAHSSSASAYNDSGDVANPDNPFSFAVMQQAYRNLMAGQGGNAKAGTSPGASIVLPTEPTDPGPVAAPSHQYVRFRPANTDQLADLDEAGFELSWEPLDETVAARTTVDFTSNTIPWVYTVVPYGTTLPAHIQTQVVQGLYLFDEDEGDMQDAPWEPIPDDPGPPTPPTGCRTQWDPVAQRPLPCQEKQAQKQKNKHNALRETTERLKRVGVSPRALYNEAMRLSHHEDELLPEGPVQARTTAARYYPSGFIRVEDTGLARAVPLRGVRVKSRRWFKFGSTLTSSTGQFRINTGYRGKARLFVEFKNSLATTRGFINSFKFWEAVLPIRAGLGLYEDNSLQNVDYTFSWQRDEQSVGARSWVAASLFNTLIDAQNFSAARGIPGPPSDLNFWLLPSPTQGSAPMLRYIASTSAVSHVIDYLLLGSGLANVFLAKQIMQRQLPDVTIDYKDDGPATMQSYPLNSLFYHELGHTQHYAQVGNNFWTAYIAYIVSNGGYGQKTTSGSGRIAISEAWGNYVESLFAYDRYQVDSPPLARRAIDRLEEQLPGNGNSNQWIVYGMLYDMTDATEPVNTRVIDNVNAYNTASVFRGLQPNVKDVPSYVTQVLAQNNQLQQPQLRTLMSSYLW